MPNIEFKYAVYAAGFYNIVAFDFISVSTIGLGLFFRFFCCCLKNFLMTKKKNRITTKFAKGFSFVPYVLLV